MFAHRTEWPLEQNALTRAIEARRARGLAALDLTESNPTRCGFHYDSDVILRALAQPAALLYEPEPHGPLSARHAVVAYYRERGVDVEPGQIFLTSSTSEAYSHLFRLLADSGDSVLAPQPSYPLFDFLAGLNDLVVIPYALTYDSEWRLDVAALEESVAGEAGSLQVPRAMIVVHPNNPTGSFVRPEELARIVEFCRGHGLAIIADEVFSDYALDEQPRLSHAACDAVLTFTLSGLSKIAALPQMKLAWIVVSGPAHLRRQAVERLEIIADTYLSVSTPVASAAPELLETRRALQPQLIARLRHNLADLDRRLTAAGATAIRLRLQGGWYAILRLTDPALSAHDLAVSQARDDGVLVHPGHFYDFPDDRHLVLSLLPVPDVFAEGIDKLLARLKPAS
jgi:aspartate/methionine/tyrosine aminotransferase